MLAIVGSDIGLLALIGTLLWAKLVVFDILLGARLFGGNALTVIASGAIASLAPILLLLVPLSALGRVTRLATLALVDVVVSTLVVANLVYLRRYDNVLSLTNALLAWQLVPTHESLLRHFRPWDVLFYLDLLLAPLLFLVRARHPRLGPKPYPRAATGLALLLAGTLAGLLPVQTVSRDVDQVFSLLWNRADAARAIGLLNYHLYELGRPLLYDNLVYPRIGAADLERVRATLSARSAVGPGSSELFGVARGRNLVVVMVESLQSFPIGLRIRGQEVTPRLSDLAARSLYFANFFDESWEATSSDGEFTSLTSLYPLSTGAVATRFP